MSRVVSYWLGMHRHVLKNKRLYAGVYATHWVQTWRNSLLCFFVFTCTTALKSRSVSFQSTPSPRTSIIPIIPPRKSPAKKHGVLKFLPKLLAMNCPVVIFVHKVYCPCLIVHVFAHACFLCFAGDWGSFHRHLGAIAVLLRLYGSFHPFPNTMTSYKTFQE